MKKVYLIINLTAGKAVISEYLGKIVDEFIKTDYEVTIHTTQSSDDAVYAAKYACENGFDLLVCAGGDGTLSQCLQGVMQCEKRVPIGYIPAGTTNDFAKSLGISKEPIAAVKTITEGKLMPCDIGGFNDKYFTYIVAFGAFTNITYETSQQFKNIFGHTAYVLGGLWQLTNIRARHMRIEYDGIIIEDEFVFGMVSNTASIGGMITMNEYMLNDGQFEVMLIKKPANPMQLKHILTSLLNINSDIDREYIRFFRTDKITFISLDDDPPAWTRDGEYGGTAAVNMIVNHRNAVSFMVNEGNMKIYNDTINEINQSEGQLTIEDIEEIASGLAP